MPGRDTQYQEIAFGPNGLMNCWCNFELVVAEGNNGAMSGVVHFCGVCSKR